MDIKKWFEEGTKLKIKELRYLKPPKAPYFLFQNQISKRGADIYNNIIENNIIIERYSETNDNSDFEEIEKVDNLLNQEYYTYERNTEWLENEKLYGTYWTLDPVIEKIRKEV